MGMSVKIFLLCITTMTTASHHVNLLYITVDETSHYALVKDLSRLVSIQCNNHNSKHYFCQYCLHSWASEEVLKKHLWRCKLHGAQRTKIQKLTTRRGMTKSSLQKQNTNYVYLLSSTRISKAFYINKTRVSHRYQNPSPPNTNITYHEEATSTGNALMEDTLNHLKWI